MSASTPEAHGPCVSCMPGECVGMFRLHPSDTDCCCGHTADSHPLPPAAPASRTVLPPRGCQQETRCISFTGQAATARDLCLRPSCRRPWLSHALSLNTPLIDISAPQPSSIAPWVNPLQHTSSSAQENTNDRRVEAFIRHRPSPSGNNGRSISNPFGGSGATNRVGSSTSSRTSRRASFPTRSLARTVGHRGQQAQPFRIGLGLYPQPSQRVSSTQHPDYTPPYPLRINDAKLPCQMRRMRERNLETSAAVSTLDPPSVVYAAVKDSIQALTIERNITIPPAPDPTDTRCTFGVLAPMNSPRNGSTMHIYSHLADCERPEWWTIANVLKIPRKGFTIPGAEQYDAYLFLAPRYGMISIDNHPCATMHLLYNLDDQSSAIEDCPNDMHLSACPSVNEEDEPCAASIASPPLLTPPPSVVGATNTGTSTLAHVLGRRGRSPSIEASEIEGERRRSRRRLSNTSDASTTNTLVDMPSSHAPLVRLNVTTASEFVESIQGQLGLMTGRSSFRFISPAHLPIPVAAEIFLKIVTSKTGGVSLETLDLQGIVCNLEAPLSSYLNTREIFVRLGPGIGVGPTRTLFDAAMNIALSNSALWIPVHDGLLSLRIGLVPTDARLNQCKMFGALLAIYIVHFGHLPVRLAPAFVVALAQGVRAIDDVIWFGAFAPDVAARLALWPRNSRPPLDNPAIQATIIDALSLAPGDLASYSEEDLNNLRSQVLESSLLGVMPGSTFDSNAHILAFKEGFNITVEQSSFNFLSLLGNTVKPLVLDLLPGVIRTAQDVIQKITWTSRGGGSLPPQEIAFRTGFERWLRGGPGHLNHPTIRELMAQDVFESVSADPGFHGRSFVRYTTGEDSLTSTPIYMKFVRPPPRRRTVNGVGDTSNDDEGIPPPLNAHVCFRTVDVPLNEKMETMVALALSSNDEAVTELDLYLHSTFVQLEGLSATDVYTTC